MQRRDEKSRQDFSWNGIDHLENIHIDGRIILKMMLKRRIMRMLIGFI
jgi:hypothetical protein